MKNTLYNRKNSSLFSQKLNRKLSPLIEFYAISNLFSWQNQFFTKCPFLSLTEPGTLANVLASLS